MGNQSDAEGPSRRLLAPKSAATDSHAHTELVVDPGYFSLADQQTTPRIEHDASKIPHRNAHAPTEPSSKGQKTPKPPYAVPVHSSVKTSTDVGQISGDHDTSTVKRVGSDVEPIKTTPKHSTNTSPRTSFLSHSPSPRKQVKFAPHIYGRGETPSWATIPSKAPQNQEGSTRGDPISSTSLSRFANQPSHHPNSPASDSTDKVQQKGSLDNPTENGQSKFSPTHTPRFDRRTTNGYSFEESTRSSRAKQEAKKDASTPRGYSLSPSPSKFPPPLSRNNSNMAVRSSVFGSRPTTAREHQQSPQVIRGFRRPNESLTNYEQTADEVISRTNIKTESRKFYQEDHDNVALRKIVQQLNQRSIDLKTENSHLESEVKGLSFQLSVVQSKLKKAQHSKDNYEGTGGNARNAQSLVDKLEKAQSRLVTLELDNARLKTQLGVKTRHLHGAQLEIENTKSEVAQKQLSLETANKQIDELCLECGQLQDIFQDLSRMTECSLQGSYGEPPRLSVLKEQLKHSADATRTESLPGHLLESAHFQGKFKLFVEQIDQQIFAHVQAGAVHKRQIQEKEQELAAQQRRFDEEFKSNSSRRIMEKMIRERRTLEDKLDLQITLEARLRKDARDLKIDLNSAQDQNEVMLEQLKNFHRLNKALKSENDEVERQKDQMSDELSAELEKERKVFREHVEEYVAKLQELEEYQRKCNDAHYLEFKELRDQRDKSKQECDEKAQSFQAAKNENAMLEDECKQLNERCAALEQQLVVLTSQHAFDNSRNLVSSKPLNSGLAEAVSIGPLMLHCESPEGLDARKEQIADKKRQLELLRQKDLEQLELMERARKWQFEQLEKDESQRIKRLTRIYPPLKANTWGELVAKTSWNRWNGDQFFAFTSVDSSWTDADKANMEKLTKKQEERRHMSKDT